MTFVGDDISFCTGLFGEGPADRRERLRQLLARLGQDALKRSKEEEKESEKDKSVSLIHLVDVLKN